MTSDEIEFMAECEHRGACGRLVTMHAISHADPFDWCMCAACPHHDGHTRDNARLERENAKLRELVADALLSTKDYAEKYGGPSNAFDASDWRIVHLRSRGRELGVEVDA